MAGAAPSGQPSTLMGFDVARLRSIQPRDYLIRFSFGAAISMVAGLVTVIFGARLGGVFLAFPAILPATLTLVEKKEDTRRADKNAGGAVLGAAAMILFAIVAYLLLNTNAILALAIAVVTWAAAAILFYLVGCRLKPEPCADDS